MSARRPHDDPEYRRARRAILEPGAICHWCPAPATTVDHLIELDRGGTNTPDNMVPACRTCNSRRGAVYGNAKRARTRAGREASQEPQKAGRASRAPSDRGTSQKGSQRPTGVSTGVFRGPDDHPDPTTKKKTAAGPHSAGPAGSRAKRPGSKATGSDRAGSGAPVVEIPPGMIPPRLHTLVDVRESMGGTVCAWADRVLGLTMMPWQAQVLEELLSHDNDRLYARTGLLSVARQNGKSRVALALLGWWTTEGAKWRREPQACLYLANLKQTADEIAGILLSAVEGHYPDARVIRTGDRRGIMMPDGSRLHLQAATDSAGHGLSLDLVVADEVWDIKRSVVEDGLMPTQRARRSPLLLMMSTAGTKDSELMQSWRDRGIQAIDRGTVNGPYWLAEWSVPATGSPRDEELWPMANPSWNHTVTLETMRIDYEVNDLQTFQRACLNQWVMSDKCWIAGVDWDSLAHCGPLPPPTVIACEVSTDMGRYNAVGAHMVDDLVVLSVVADCRTIEELWEAVAAAADGSTLMAVSVGLEMHLPLAMRRRMTVVGYAEILKWTGIVRGMIDEGRVRHTGSVTLADHMTRAVAAQTQQGIALSTRSSKGAINLARCSVWATALATRARSKARPTIVSARRGA